MKFKTILLSLLTVAGAVHAAEITNKQGMVFVEIPAGSFLMGSRDNDNKAFDVERSQHRVTISKPFYFGKFEVTQAEWEKVMGSNPYTLDRSNPYYNLPGMAKRITKPNHPATVSWLDAQAFLKKLNQLDPAHHYRLPTEAEWEYAARAGTQTAYSFGDNEQDLSKYAWFGENFATGGTHPVGRKLPNPWGLYDIHGNAWEWVEDSFQPNYEKHSVVDPLRTQGKRKVVRGGSWHSTATSWRSAFRKPYDADYRGISIGFRVVMEK